MMILGKQPYSTVFTTYDPSCSSRLMTAEIRKWPMILPATPIQARQRGLLNMRHQLHPRQLTQLHSNRRMHRFKNESSLRIYTVNSGFTQETFELKELLTHMKNILKTDEMFDPSNPAILLLTLDFGMALGADVLHVSEFQEQILPHLVEVLDRTKVIREQATIEKVLSPNIQSVCIPSTALTGLLRHQQPNYVVGPIDYGSITDQISSYILENHAMLKTSNIRVLNIAEDPILQPIFNVNYLHRCQIFSLLRGQLRSGDDFVIKTTKITNSNSSIIRIDRALADLGLGMDTEPVEASPQTHDLVTKIQ